MADAQSTEAGAGAGSLSGWAQGSSKGSAADTAALEDAIKSADVVFFDDPFCPYCRRAELALKTEGIDFTLFPIAEHRDALEAKTGKTSAPSVWVKGTFIGGCNDGTEPWHGVMPCIKSGKIKELLEVAESESALKETEPESTAVAVVDSAIKSADVVFFDDPFCPYCRRAELALKTEGIDFTLFPIAEHREALEAKTGKTSAPSVWVKGPFIGGCNDGTEP